MDSDNQADKAWLLSVQRKLYRWSLVTSLKPLESRMHNERCTSGSVRGRGKPVVREDHKALASYSTCAVYTKKGENVK